MTNCCEETMSLRRIGGIIALLLTALIWGFAFVAQKQGVSAVSPQVFLSLRSFLGGIALIPVIAVMDLLDKRRPSLWGRAAAVAERRRLLAGGVCCGVMLGTASLVQQWGLVYSTAGKGGFLTALYIIFVPLIGIFFRRRVSRVLWFSVLLVLTGAFLLCFGADAEMTFSGGDILLLLCAVGYAGHILVIDYFAPGNDCVRMSCIQFFTAGILAGAAAWFAGDRWEVRSIGTVLFPLLYCGICSSGIAFTLQIIGQKYVHPVMASLLLSLESVFSVVGGSIFLGERLTVREITGCCIIFAAIVIAQIPVKSPKP